MKVFNFQDISKYRTGLMGIATLMIIVCHAPASGVLMPNILARIFELGNFGVDIFLFLSGLGCYYSLSTNSNLKDYYKRRYIRIGVPYILITLPFVIFFLLINKYTLYDAILSLTTFNYWLEHRGAWFVALLIPLYLVSPVVYKLLLCKKKILLLALMIICILILCNLEVKHFEYCNILKNIQFVLQRLPSYLIGVAIGKLSKEGYQIRYVNLIFFLSLGLLIYLLCRLCLEDLFVGWLLVPIIIFLLIVFIKNILFINNFFCFFGRISLESYLSNIYINNLFIVLIPDNINNELLYGRYLEYSIVIVGGILIAIFLNKLSDKMITLFVKI